MLYPTELCESEYLSLLTIVSSFWSMKISLKITQSLNCMLYEEETMNFC